MGGPAFFVLVLFVLFNRLDEAYTNEGGQSALLGLPVQILILSTSILTDKLRIIFDQISVSDIPDGPVKFTHRINPHS